jgi:WD40 repeat protein
VIASSDLEGIIFTHRMKDFDNKSKLVLNGYKCQTLKFSHLKENVLGSGYDDGTVAVWDINTNSVITKFEGQH